MDERLTYADEHAIRERDGETWPDGAAAIRDRRDLLAELDAVCAERNEARMAFSVASRAFDQMLDGERRAQTAIAAERDEARAQIGDVRASISAHKIRVATDERDEAIDRADRAEAGLTALHAAALPHVGAEFATEDETRALKAALADTEAAAEAYTRRVRAEALREAADEIDRGEVPGRDSSWLRARAAEIRGGR